VRKVVECGTRQGYQKHKRRKEDACEPCLVAQREYKREWRARSSADSELSRPSNVLVPKMLFVELYLAAPAELQEQVEDEVGGKRLDYLVKLHERVSGRTSIESSVVLR